MSVQTGFIWKLSENIRLAKRIYGNFFAFEVVPLSFQILIFWYPEAHKWKIESSLYAARVEF